MLDIVFRYGFKQIDDNIIFAIFIEKKDTREFVDSFKLFFKIENGKLIEITNELQEETIKNILTKNNNNNNDKE